MLKKLDKMLIIGFFKVFFIILCIALFVMYTQNAVNWVSDLAGKNIGFSSYLKLITYLVAISASLIGYPVATLISSVIYIKELVEKSEIVAMRSAGISERRILKPLIFIKIVMILIMYFGNSFLTPEANRRLFSLTYKIRKTNPMLDIKEGVFYNALKGYSIKVNKKLSDERRIEDIIIYDHTEDKGNVLVTIANYGELYITPNEKFLIMNLKDGYSYIEKSVIDNEKNNEKFIRSNFKTQEIILDTSDLGINIGKELFKDRFYSKSSFVLEKEILMMKKKVQLIEQSKFKNIFQIHEYMKNLVMNIQYIDQSSFKSKEDIQDLNERLLLELRERLGQHNLENIIDKAKNQVNENEKALKYNIPEIKKLKRKIRKFRIQHLSYLLQAVSIVLVFIIGASLGLMSRKGEIKIQAIMFVLLFLVYYFLIYEGIYLAELGILNPFVAISMPFSLLLVFAIFFVRKALRGDVISLEYFKYLLFYRRKKVN